jgi:hypothetical protein
MIFLQITALRHSTDEGQPAIDGAQRYTWDRIDLLLAGTMRRSFPTIFRIRSGQVRAVGAHFFDKF